MLNLVGLGLGSEDDLTLRGCNVLKKCENVFLDTYTSPFLGDVQKIEALIGKKITLCNRARVETDDTIIELAKTQDVAFAVVGDVFAATTHMDLVLRARKMNIRVTVVHNASILTAVGETGLSLYKFGQVTSIPFVTGK